MAVELGIGSRRCRWIRSGRGTRHRAIWPRQRTKCRPSIDDPFHFPFDRVGEPHRVALTRGEHGADLTRRGEDASPGRGGGLFRDDNSKNSQYPAQRRRQSRSSAAVAGRIRSGSGRAQATWTRLSTSASRPARTASWISWISSDRDRQRRRDGERRAERAEDDAVRADRPVGLAGSAGSSASASGSSATPTSCARAAANLADERVVGERRERRRAARPRAPARAAINPSRSMMARFASAAAQTAAWPAVGLAVADGDPTGLAPERLGDAAGDDDAAERQIAARHALGEGDQVGLDAEALEAEPAAEPAEAADDRVARRTGRPSSRQISATAWM